MNIFKILSSNDGTLKEPNVSSFLAYLLDPNEDHGLGDSLLKSILSDFESLKDKDFSDYDVEVNPEYKVDIDDAVPKKDKESKKKHRDIDIVILFWKKEKKSKTEQKNKLNAPELILCLENKIKDASIEKDQLDDELDGITKQFQKGTDIYFCYLTLQKTEASDNVFKNFVCDQQRKIHLYWKNDNTNEKNSILEKILAILELERNGEIDPISEESIFLLKSFIGFIRANFSSFIEKKNANHERRIYGKPVIDFFRDFYNKMEINKDYSDKEIKKSIKEAIFKESGVEPNSGTIQCHLYQTTVNDDNRLHYSVSEKNHKDRDFFYMINPKSKNKVLRKYISGMPEIEVKFNK